jgi:ferric-dicitrate binding protein FerR (iron transport regulator)
MNQTSLAYYLDRYTRGTLTPEERVVLARLLHDPAYEAEVQQLLDENWAYWEELGLDLPKTYSRLEQQVAQRIANEEAAAAVATEPPVHRVHFLRRGFFKYAAAIIILFGIAAYLYFANEKPQKNLAKNDHSLPADISPGGNKAVLTLSDGSTITLDSAANGVLAQQGKTSVVKLSNGEIAYRPKGAAADDVVMNTLTTPNGGQYQLNLPDGSKIWLNAASSVTYPAVFVGPTRKICITGEAYLEVAKDKTRPFLVDIDGKSVVEVLGTSFNINSYGDEGQIKTTLITGSVRMSSDRQPRTSGTDGVILKPGQQAIQGNTNTPIVIQSADIDKVLAWKNGVFSFEGKSFQAVMMDIQRWYNVQIQYEGKLPAFQFSGKMDRGVMLSTVLKFLSDYGVKTRLEGNILIVGEG